MIRRADKRREVDKQSELMFCRADGSQLCHTPTAAVGGRAAFRTGRGGEQRRLEEEERRQKRRVEEESGRGRGGEWRRRGGEWWREKRREAERGRGGEEENRRGRGGEWRRSGERCVCVVVFLKVFWLLIMKI